MKAAMLVLSAVLLIVALSACGTAVNGYDHLYRPMVATDNEETLAVKDSIKSKRFVWEYNGQNFAVILHLDPQLNLEYEKAKRSYSMFKIMVENDYSAYLDTLPGDSSVIELARQLKEIASQHHFTTNQLVELTVNFFQSLQNDEEEARDLGFVVNRDAILTYRVPFQVFFYGKAICLDKGVAAMSVFRELSIGTALLMMPTDDPQINHAAVGIRSAHKYGLVQALDYHYAEMTQRVRIGTMPKFVRQEDLDKLKISFSITGKIYQSSLANN